MPCKCYHADKNFLGKIGVCWGTKECEACSCGGDEAKCDFYDYVLEIAKKPITNADRIRAMTDEELATFFSENFDCGVCEYMFGIKPCQEKCCPKKLPTIF